ncbi:MAG: hypothetical protein E3J72_11080 [Planctomycetota bacterium]|nr:MAG: hypothetical protein E3J72_11080 [Planctomycetota bacterium]
MNPKHALICFGVIIALLLVVSAGCRDNRKYRRYDPDPDDVGYQTTVAGGKGDQRRPDIARNDLDRNFLVVYETDQFGDGDIVARELTAGVTFILIEGAAGAQRYPSVAYNSNANQYLVAWEDKRGGPAADIYGRLIDADVGETIGNSFIITAAAADEEMPVVAFAEDSDVYCVAWQDDASGKRDIRAVILDSGGSPVTGALDVCTETDNQRDPRITYSPSEDEFFIVWTDYRNDAGPDIYGRLLEADGSFPYSDVEIMCQNEQIETPDVVWNPLKRNYCVVASRLGSQAWQIVGRLLTRTGSASSSIKQLSMNWNDQRSPRVSYNPRKGRYNVVWEESERYYATQDIARRFFGSSLIPVAFTRIVSGSGINQGPAVAVGDDGTIITVWTSFKNNSDDILSFVEK